MQHIGSAFDAACGQPQGQNINTLIRIASVWVVAMIASNVVAYIGANKGVFGEDFVALLFLLLWLLTLAFDTVVLIRVVNNRKRTIDSVAYIVVLMLVAAIAIIPNLLVLLFALVHM